MLNTMGAIVAKSAVSFTDLEKSQHGIALQGDKGDERKPDEKPFKGDGIAKGKGVAYFAPDGDHAFKLRAAEMSVPCGAHGKAYPKGGKERQSETEHDF